MDSLEVFVLDALVVAGVGVLLTTGCIERFSFTTGSATNKQ